MKLKLCLIVSCALLFISVNAQFRLSGQVTGLKLPASSGNYSMSFGPGIDFAYTPEDSKVEGYFAASYLLPATSVSTGYVYNTTSSSAEATLTQKTSVIDLSLGARYYLLDRDGDFNLYPTVSVNYLLANTTAEYTNVPSGYAPAYNDGAAGKSNQLMIGLGAGLEYKIGDGAIFAQGHLRFPASTYNSRSGYADDVQIPAHLGFAIGYRFSFGGGGSGW